MRIALSRLESPIGTLTLAAGAAGLCALEFKSSKQRAQARLALERPGATFEDEGALIEPIKAKLEEYFGGALKALDEIPVDPDGTEFQKQVWSALRKIGPGRTASYGELARTIGRPKAVRAVGMANARNPIALVVPCHRIIASDGTLCGYGGGLPQKEWLLRHEGARLL
jgi:methylated-DNA-[protein]-cysteine S-methyltransferase